MQHTKDSEVHLTMKSQVLEKENSKKSNESEGVFKFGIKRSMDIAFSLLFFFFLGWLYLIVWMCVLLTTGSPAIYRHPRIGKNGKEFDCLKFRSMSVNSAEILKKHLENNADARKEWDQSFKLKNDPRITKFGRIIRKTSLDELPQFYNVLKGEMSLVGPRPVVASELDRYYGDAAVHYKSVKPGITGPWQIGGRSDIGYAERVLLDVGYAKNWSIIGDLRIILKTVMVVLSRQGSY